MKVELKSRHGLTVTLLHGDWEQFWPVACDAVVTDPPYGIDADKEGAHSSIRDDDKWPTTQWDKKRPSDETLRKLPALAPRVAIWGGNYFADCLPASAAWLIWRKPEAETGFSMADAELCWTNGSFAARMRTMPRRDGNDHPTQKPVLAMAWPMELLKLSEGITVFDPYMGSGTTAIACLRTGRNFIGVEREEIHFKTALRRIKEEIEGGLL